MLQLHGLSSIPLCNITTMFLRNSLFYSIVATKSDLNLGAKNVNLFLSNALAITHSVNHKINP